MSILISSLLGLLACVGLLGSLWLRDRKKIVGLEHDLAGVRKDLIRQLREAEHFRMACEHANDGIVIQEMDGTIVWPNPAYCRIMGRSPDEMIGRNPLEYALPPEDTPSQDEIRAFAYDPDDPKNDGLQLFRNQRKNGELFWNQLSVSFRKSAVGDRHAILVCRDVTKQIEQEERLRQARNRLEYEATHDSLTGLSNRAAFLDYASDCLKASADSTDRTGILHFDLDRFKEINDTHGHSAGDAALIHVARAIQEVIGDTGLVARVGGDEFVAVQPSANDLRQLQSRARAISERICEPFEWNGRVIAVTCSVGAAISQLDDIDLDDLLLKADFALYEAKRSGRACVRPYDAALYLRHTSELRRSKELADAIDTETLDHVFQPTFDLRSQSVLGFETLVRWTHPEDGTIRPDEFLPTAAELGLLGELDLGSMTSALHQKRALDAQGHVGLGIAFNASAELLSHPEFINRLVWGVEAGGIERRNVTIEVLETTAFGDASEQSSHAATIRDLRDAGFQVHLDDFGVGYAGLAHLAGLDMTGVKIDRSLIKNLLVDPTSAKIVRKIIELCNDLGLDVIAEGVETREIANTLMSMGCTMIQGYWIAKPLRPEEVMPWLEARSDVPPIRLISG